MDSSPTETNTKYWQDLSRYEKVKKIIGDGYFADCKFVVGPEDETAETIHGHKVFLTMESPVFEKMFSGNYVEAEDKAEIRLYDVTPHDFKNLIYMMYSNSTSNLEKFSLEEIIILYQLCDKYMISSILLPCFDYIKNPKFLNETSIENLIAVFEFARDLEEKSLLEVTSKVVQTRCKTELNSRTDTLTEEAFYDFVRTLSESSLEGYKSPADKELYIFSVVNSYFVNNNLLEVLNNDKQADPNDESMENSKKFEITTINRIKLLNKNLLKLIQFEKLEVADFQNGPGKSEIINFEQKYCILSDLIKKSCCNRTRGKCKIVHYNGTVLENFDGF